MNSLFRAPLLTSSLLALALGGCAADSRESAAAAHGANADGPLTAEIRSNAPFGALNRLREGRPERPVDPADWVALPALRDGRGASRPNKITVDSTCRAGAAQGARREFENVFEMQVRSLLPESAIANPAEPERALTCTFEFIVTDARGAVRRLEMRDMPIEAPVAEAGLRLSAGGIALDPIAWRSNVVNLWDAAGVTLSSPRRAPAAEGTLALRCEKFFVERRTADPGSIDVAELLRSPTARSTTTAGLYGELRVAELAKSESNLEQTCRVTFVSPSETSASAYFLARLRPPGVRFEGVAAAEFAEGPRSNERRVALFKLRVENGDLVDRWVYVPSGSAGSFHFQMMHLAWVAPAVQYIHGAQVSLRPRWTWQGSTDDVVNVASGMIIKIGPGRARQIVIFATTLQTCYPFANAIRVGFAEDLSPRVFVRPPPTDAQALAALDLNEATTGAQGRFAVSLPGQYAFVTAPRNPINPTPSEVVHEMPTGYRLDNERFCRDAAYNITPLPSPD